MCDSRQLGLGRSWVCGLPVWPDLVLLSLVCHVCHVCCPGWVSCWSLLLSRVGATRSWSCCCFTSPRLGRVAVAIISRGTYESRGVCLPSCITLDPGVVSGMTRVWATYQVAVVARCAFLSYAVTLSSDRNRLKSASAPPTSVSILSVAFRLFCIDRWCCTAPCGLCSLPCFLVRGPCGECVGPWPTRASFKLPLPVRLAWVCAATLGRGGTFRA